MNRLPVLPVLLTVFSAVCATLFSPYGATRSAAEDVPSSSKAEVPESVRDVVAANNQFAFDLYQRLRAEHSGNLFYSPYSISTALAMTYGGARGETATQMAKVLHFEMPQDELAAAYGRLTDRMQSAKKAEKSVAMLRIANRLWGQKGFDFRPEYLKLTRTHYDAELGRLDFAHSEEARRTINQWVAAQTERKIQDLIPSGTLNSDTRLVLTNAIYFKGKWEHPFEKNATREESFDVTSDKTTKAMFMSQKRRFPYAKLEEAQLIELPYAGDELSMLVLLPKEIDGLAQLEKQLTSENLTAWSEKLRAQEVQVYLPRFEMTQEFGLGSALKSLGMTDAFDPNQADFSGMAERNDLFISAALHKSFVKVDEEGTEAAAATGIVVGVTSVQLDPLVFRADHPFLFLIREKATGSILFVGSVRNPNG